MNRFFLSLLLGAMSSFGILLLSPTTALAQGSKLQATPEKIKAFISEVETAAKARDIGSITKLYDFDGTPQALVDQRIHFWEEAFVTREFASAGFVSLDVAKSTMDEGGLQALANGRLMNGRLYSPNIPLIGFVKVDFANDANQIYGSVIPLGISQGGAIKFAGTKVEQVGGNTP